MNKFEILLVLLYRLNICFGCVLILNGEDWILDDNENIIGDFIWKILLKFLQKYLSLIKLTHFLLLIIYFYTSAKSLIALYFNFE